MNNNDSTGRSSGRRRGNVTRQTRPSDRSTQVRSVRTGSQGDRRRPSESGNYSSRGQVPEQGNRGTGRSGTARDGRSGSNVRRTVSQNYGKGNRRPEQNEGKKVSPKPGQKGVVPGRKGTNTSQGRVPQGRPLQGRPERPDKKTVQQGQRRARPKPKPRKVVRMPRRNIHFPIGHILLGLMIVYLVVAVVDYTKTPRISIYEVTEKNIADDNNCRGMIIREERVVNTSSAGYINYYIGNNERVAKNQTVYSVDESGNIHDMLLDAGTKTRLSKENIQWVRDKISSYRKGFSELQYSKTSNLHNEMENAVLELTTEDMLKNLSSVMSAASGSGVSFRTVAAQESGMVSYYVDDYSGLKPDHVTADMFEEDYERTNARTDQLVSANSPVYKLVTSEDWTIVLHLSLEQYNALKAEEKRQKSDGAEQATIIITLTRAGIDKRVTYTLKKESGSYFAIASLDKYMSYYIDDRFLDVSLNLNSEPGLKIPKSAILEKEFYVIPNEFMIRSEDTESQGVTIESYDKNGNVDYIFTPAYIYYQDDVHTYINKELCESGSYLYNKETKERFQLGESITLEGVYNTNKGYCIFKRIERLKDNGEYCIVAKNTKYGISVYDHIIVDASTVTDQEIISKK